MSANRREFLLGAATVAATSSLPSFARAASLLPADAAANAPHLASPFLLEFDGPALTSLKFAGDAFPTNYVATGQKLGHIEITWRRPNGPWQSFHSADATAQPSSNTFHTQDDQGEAFAITVRLEPQSKFEIIRWYCLEIIRSVEPCRPVERASGSLNELEMLVCCDVLRTLKQHVLEEVRETRSPLWLARRAHVIPQIYGYGRHGIVRRECNAQTVVEPKCLDALFHL